MTVVVVFVGENREGSSSCRVGDAAFIERGRDSAVERASRNEVSEKAEEEVGGRENGGVVVMKGDEKGIA